MTTNTMATGTALPRVSARLPYYDPSKSSLAYGDGALPKLNRELHSPDLGVRQQALLLLADVLHSREKLATALREGIAESLQQLLCDKDALVRERAAKVLSNIAQHSLAREAFLSSGIITSLSKLVCACLEILQPLMLHKFADSEYKVRVNAHLAVEMCSRNPAGAKGAVDAKLIPLCVERLTAETTSDLKEIILNTLHWCLVVDTTDGLACDAISLCQDLLGHVEPNIRGQAARLLLDLTVTQDGKERACEVQACIPKLINLLDDTHAFVRAQAIAALMSIAVITKGKYAILSSEVLDRLVELLDDGNSEIRLNSIRLLGLLAETPSGKQDLKPALKKLQVMSREDDSDMVKKAAHTATKIITWLP